MTKNTFCSMPDDVTKPIVQQAFLRRFDNQVFSGLHHGFDILSDRIAIKIAVTTAGVQAAKILAGEGIKTLGTALFSVPQALAAAQAGMFAISLYFNGKLSHFYRRELR